MTPRASLTCPPATTPPSASPSRISMPTVRRCARSCGMTPSYTRPTRRRHTPGPSPRARATPTTSCSPPRPSPRSAPDSIRTSATAKPPSPRLKITSTVCNKRWLNTTRRQPSASRTCSSKCSTWRSIFSPGKEMRSARCAICGTTTRTCPPRRCSPPSPPAACTRRTPAALRRPLSTCTTTRSMGRISRGTGAANSAPPASSTLWTRRASTSATIMRASSACTRGATPMRTAMAGRC
mmetsp:Transcript_21346/g.46832  ORF Transcript_21346/g.46832 Transcript_21346/m.46832 type:complete len:238 (-) Transcript_21346:689-1402(-)